MVDSLQTFLDSTKTIRHKIKAQAKAVEEFQSRWQRHQVSEISVGRTFRSPPKKVLPSLSPSNSRKLRLSSSVTLPRKGTNPYSKQLKPRQAVVKLPRFLYVKLHSLYKSTKASDIKDIYLK